MKKVTVTGKTVEEAVDKALLELNTNRDQVNIRVLEEPNKGFLGLIGSKDAVVEVEKKIDPVQEAKKFLLSVFDAMNVELHIDIEQKADHVVFDIVGEELGIIIGRHGHTLDSFQYLTNIVANRYSDQSIRIVLDGENYRERRRETLEALADRLAEKVLRSKKNITLEPMSPMERKIIHTRLQSKANISTASIGKDEKRRVVISYKENE